MIASATSSILELFAKIGVSLAVWSFLGMIFLGVVGALKRWVFGPMKVDRGPREEEIDEDIWP